jgi:ferritin-like metal-binding protein YciE
MLPLEFRTSSDPKKRGDWSANWTDCPVMSLHQQPVRQPTTIARTLIGNRARRSPTLGTAARQHLRATHEAELSRSWCAKGLLQPRYLIPGEEDMKLFSANIEDLQTLYITSLKKALDMEEKITQALPDMIDNSTDLELSDAFRNHLEETQGHVAKIETILNRLIGEPKTETCKVINGLTAEASDTIKDVKDPTVRDIALICAAQEVEHHEIALYGTLRRWAGLLGLNDDAFVLEMIETEELNADETLTDISSRVNLEAAA